MRWTVTLAFLALILFQPLPASAQEEAEPDAANQIEATDFVIGLHAFNGQVLDALEQQPTRRVMVLPFACDKSAALGKYITEQLVTAIAASRHYEIVDSGTAGRPRRRRGTRSLRAGQLARVQDRLAAVRQHRHRAR